MKVWNYVFIAITMMIFLQFAGFPTAFNGILGFVSVTFNDDNSLKSFDLDTSNMVGYLKDNWIAGLAALGGIIIGLWVSGETLVALRVGIASAIFFAFTKPLYFVVTHGLETGISAWAVGVMAIIFIPFSIAYLIALIEYIIGGND